MAWTFIGACEKRQAFKIDGLDVWSLPWRKVGVELAFVREPMRGHLSPFDIYEISDGKVSVCFAAGDFMNDTIYFFVDLPDAQPAQGSAKAHLVITSAAVAPITDTALRRLDEHLIQRTATIAHGVDASQPFPPACVARSVLLEIDGYGDISAFERVRSTAQAALAGLPIDINIVRDGPDRRKRLLIADMESTIIEQEMLDELGDFIGARARIEEITARAMRGELDFEAALDERVGLLKGLDASVLDEVAKRITLMPGAETLVSTMKANGAFCALVSGGFTVFTSRVAKQLGFDEHRANVLEIADGKLTGRVIRPILGREAKLAALIELTTKLGLQSRQTLAVGDGANDLAMLGAAGLGVAFRAKPKVSDAVAAMPNGAVITHGDLTALLALQGYGESEFDSGQVIDGSTLTD
jgi:phosphoserine phosphatase